MGTYPFYCDGTGEPLQGATEADKKAQSAYAFWEELEDFP
jgi:hypothetical protein